MGYVFAQAPRSENIKTLEGSAFGGFLVLDDLQGGNQKIKTLLLMLRSCNLAY